MLNPPVVWDTRFFNNEYPAISTEYSYCIGPVSLIQVEGAAAASQGRSTPCNCSPIEIIDSVSETVKIEGSLTLDFVLK
jgi:hypothetical protein